MIKLGVNIDHVATLRQARKEEFPSVIAAAASCEKAGADSITVHLREDRRHIQDKDVYGLRESLRTKLNLEMAANEEIVAVALDVKPDYVCLVPEKRQELTTEGGLDVAGQKKKLAQIVAKLKASGIFVSMFIDADIKQVLASHEIGADCIELHTGKYAQYFKRFGKNSKEFKSELKRISEASNKAVGAGLVLNAGHGLDYDNIAPICSVAKMNEFNIGFAIIARAVFVGIETAVKEMKVLLK
ncbi:pyridoxine 5'-phosphate synthase [Endomicrobium proavitum]|uniref:Pyridoxine 5'-phosphate synthase n=1 Tax=Endomicrobium proavitum TaxID=1408281 RepID=A0A0G3WK34_9BACT|nr:pyridoxine 5'-phosphate synthase [Endomicrobium proavitum]AKL98242.1 pyridoxine 5-phosphate synthase [Endomicrobium proavitum]